MTNSRTTRKALVSSALAVLMCMAMLIGTTFAWFTDTASAAVNKIQAGNLNVELLDKDGATLAEDAKLTWVKADGHTEEEVLWEPNCTYDLDQFQIKNAGNLALKYKVVLNASTITKKGDKTLLDVIEWTVKIGDETVQENVLFDDLGTTDGMTIIDGEKLLADKTVKVSVTGHMKSDAGNEYQGLSIDGFGITVVATQATEEYDSYNNTYDANAQYPEVSYAVVGSSDDLAAAIKNATDADGNATNKVVAELTTEGTYTLPNIENKEVTIIGDKDTVIDMATGETKVSSVELDGVTVDFSESYYTGFTHSEKVVYKDCTITGLQFLYADEVEFINCTFNQTKNDEYHLWTYTAKNVTFTNCTFNSTSKSKAVLCYTDNSVDGTLTRTFNKCTFKAEGDAEKSAIMINPSAKTASTYVINVNNCSATGYGTDTHTNSALVGVKEAVKDNITVNIDGITVYTHTN